MSGWLAARVRLAVTELRALVSDLDGVLLLQDWPGAAAYWESALDLPAEKFMRALFGGSDDLVLVGRLDEDAWWEVVAARLRIGDSQMAKVRADLERREVLDSRLLSYYRSLRRNRLKVALVSNAWSGARRHLANLGLLADFDEIMISAEVGVAKRRVAIFDLAAERLAVTPSECIFVDDQLDCMTAAAHLGMWAIQHRSAETTIAAVEALLTAENRS